MQLTRSNVTKQTGALFKQRKGQEILPSAPEAWGLDFGKSGFYRALFLFQNHLFNYLFDKQSDTYMGKDKFSTCWLTPKTPASVWPRSDAARSPGLPPGLPHRSEVFLN